MLELNKIYNIDCIKGMQQIEFDSIDLIITDPPYGINITDNKSLSVKGTYHKKINITTKTWDNNIPTKQHFNEMFRISRNQIIFGGNYFTEYLKPSKCWIIWDKKENLKSFLDFADCELIWTSFNKPSKIFRHKIHGFIRDDKNEKRFDHPTQKPLNLLKWIINNYSKKNDLILDAFLGTGTTAVACKQLERNYIGFEIDKKYYDIANERIKSTKPNKTIDDF